MPAFISEALCYRIQHELSRKLSQIFRQIKRLFLVLSRITWSGSPHPKRNSEARMKWDTVTESSLDVYLFIIHWVRGTCVWWGTTGNVEYVLAHKFSPLLTNGFIIFPYVCLHAKLSFSRSMRLRFIPASRPSERAWVALSLYQIIIWGSFISLAMSEKTFASFLFFSVFGFQREHKWDIN